MNQYFKQLQENAVAKMIPVNGSVIENIVNKITVLEKSRYFTFSKARFICENELKEITNKTFISSLSSDTGLIYVMTAPIKQSENYEILVYLEKYPSDIVFSKTLAKLAKVS